MATLTALTKDHAGKLMEAVDAAGAVEPTKSLLEERVKKLEADLEDHGKKISTLKAERDKALHSLMEAQVAASEKTQQLTSAKKSIADLELKLTTLKETLETARGHEKTLIKDLPN